MVYSRVVIPFVILVVCIHVPEIAPSIFHPHKKTVRVHNKFGHNITVHCKSKNNDLGYHNLPNGGVFEWKFRPNLWGTTLFFCGLKCKNRKGVFNLYVNDRDSKRCRECVWIVNKNGVRGYNKEGGDEQIWFRWVSKPKPIKSYFTN